MKIHVKVMTGALIAGAILAVCATGCATSSKARMPEKGMKKKAAVTQAVYVCPGCKAMSMKAGKCAECNKDLQEMHLLGVKDGKAMLCACTGKCKCDAKGVKDGKCACGKDVEMVSCKGKHACAMGCPMISDTPGKCACGMDMKKCE